MSPRYTISILALDGLDMTKKCLQSLIDNSEPSSLVVILTNNASRDGTKEYFDSMAKTHSFITVVHNEENLGFIPTNNLAFEMAREFGTKYFVTVNNDLEVPVGWQDAVEAQFNTHAKAAIVGPKGTTSQLNAQMLGNSAAKYEYVEGSFMVVKQEVIPKGQSLFSDYLEFIYHEDSDLSLRMQRAGFTIHQADFHIKHRNGSTCTRHPDAVKKCREANAKNQQTMMKRWAHWNKVRCFNFPIMVRRRIASGDALLATPIIKALKEQWPLCPIDVETNAPEIFDGNPYVRKAGMRLPFAANTMLVNLDGAYEKTPQKHVLESYAIAAGVHPLKEPKLELFNVSGAPAEMMKDTWCGVHVGPTTWPSKNWPAERWVEVVSWLKQTGFKVLLLGDKSPVRYAADLDMRGQKGVSEMAGMIKACKLFVGLDSFPAHVAATLEIPSVVLYGVTNPACFKVASGRYTAVTSDPNHPSTGLRNRVANITFLRNNDSVMRTITVDQVKAAILEIQK